MNTAPSPVTVQKILFKPGEYVEVRRRLGRVVGGKQLVIYVRAMVVSASAGTDSSYLVQYPASNTIPSRTARVPASDARAARHFPPPPHSAVDDVARSASSKRPLPSEQSERGGCDCCNEAKNIGKGIPKDVLERLIAEHEKEVQAKKKKKNKKAWGDRAELLSAPVKAAGGTRKMAAPENRQPTVESARWNTSFTRREEVVSGSARPAMFQYQTTPSSWPHDRTF